MKRNPYSWKENAMWFALGVCAVALFIGGGYAVLLIVGETIEHFTPEECQPFHQCTPKGEWNHPNCKCWEQK